MAAEVAWRSVPESACDGDARILAELLRHIYERGHWFAFCVYAHGVVVGLYARSERCATRAGVGDELVGCPRLRQTCSGGVLEPQLASVGCPCGVDVHEAHAVANHQYHVLHLLALRRRDLLNGVWLVVCEGLGGHVVLCAGTLHAEGEGCYD